jgi:hypothetical protein
MISQNRIENEIFNSITWKARIVVNDKVIGNEKDGVLCLFIGSFNDEIEVFETNVMTLFHNAHTNQYFIVDTNWNGLITCSRSNLITKIGVYREWMWMFRQFGVCLVCVLRLCERSRTNLQFVFCLQASQEDSCVSMERSQQFDLHFTKKRISCPKFTPNWMRRTISRPFISRIS